MLVNLREILALAEEKKCAVVGTLEQELHAEEDRHQNAGKETRIVLRVFNR